MIIFHSPDIASTHTLPESDSRHCVRVLRMQSGEHLQVIDGAGMMYTCRLSDANPRKALVEIIDSTPMPLPWAQKITVAIAPTKHMDRMEWMVEKLTEMGVNRIIPVRCQRSERKEINTERLRKIAVSAMKQSLKATLPVIDEITPLPRIIGGFEYTQRFVAYCDENTPRVLLAKSYKPFTDVTLLIGPEGDFSPEEIKDAIITHRWAAVSLGNVRLRTETAAIVAVNTIHTIDQYNE